MDVRDEKLRKVIAEQAAEWHVACSEGELSPQRARDFMRWLRVSPIHVAEFLAISKIANAMPDATRGNTESLSSLLASQDELLHVPAELRARGEVVNTMHPLMLHSRIRVKHPRGPRFGSRRFLARWAVGAATAIVVMGVAAIGMHLMTSRQTGQIFATHHGEIRTLRLTDGTLVELDSDTAIRVRFGRASRTITVEDGQAYFDVAADPKRPFRVKAGNSLIQDIGTAFDVYRQTSDTRVVVASGRVDVWNMSRAHVSGADRVLSWVGLSKRNRGEPVASLVAGQQATLTDGGRVAQLGTADVSIAVAWRNGLIAFDDQTVATVAAEFNRYNNEKIDIEAPHIGALQITGVFNVRGVADFVAFLRTLPNVTVKDQGQMVVVGTDPHVHTRRN